MKVIAISRPKKVDNGRPAPVRHQWKPNMDLEKQTSILRSAKTGPTSNPIDKPTLASLFEAVRRWNNNEGLDAFDIEARLTNQQIQEISRSEIYKDRLLAFDERR